ncbi:N-acetylglucosamine-6-phosphate deacetylase isoform X5 [Peromyscus leucopus]|uniref:N-acetylglucosamine-6-phosphate deacetylase isoform X5 n=1 Tax=Peromyscus leucopus TaxID=10041 RepID=UPI0010A11717|nr:N-acetylglucosamine-6-phosphate deacetylase isoform X5 [Peromyscus leucopus]
MWSVVTWARSPRDSLAVESHVVRPVPASDCQCTGNCGLSPKACWVRHSSECVAANLQRWPRCASSPTAASCAAARCSGGFGVDFSRATEDVGSGIALVAQRILSHGVTSFCPTLVTSPPEVYHKVLPQIPVKSGGPHGAGVLGHSVADLAAAEEAVQNGATFITHLFNAMLPFHHRDPGIVGLLTSDQLPPGHCIFYGMIADGIHTNPAALRIAHRAHPQGLVLVTDAVPALGLGNGRHTLGQQEVEVDGLIAHIAGTKTLCGSIAPMDVCIRHFLQATGCSVESALEAASLHPAQLLGLEKTKGNLDFGADADFVVLDDSLHVQATYISGELVWQAEEAGP